MRVMIISDLHYDRRVYKGIDESKAWSWLMEIVDYHRPNLLLSCGDWGSAINPEEFYKLLERTTVLTIYGNHDNMDVLTKMYNIRTSNYLPILMKDGEIYKFNDLNIAGINGIIAKKKKTKKGVPRKTVEEFLRVAEELRGKNIDVLLLHETPYLPELFPFMRDDFASRTTLKVVERVKPRLIINGHTHSGGYKVYSFPWRTKYIYVSSDQKEKCYLIIYSTSNDMMIEVWRNYERFMRYRYREL